MSSFWKFKAEEFLKYNSGFILIDKQKLVRYRDIYKDILEFSSILKREKLIPREIIFLKNEDPVDLLITFFGSLIYGITPILLPSLEIPDWGRNIKIIEWKNGKFKITKNFQTSDLKFHPISDFFLFTSGTSQKSKCIGITNEGLEFVLQTHIPHLNFREGISVSTLPYTHVFGLIMDLFLSLSFQKSIFRPNPHSIENLIHSLSGENFSISGVPLLFQKLFEAGISLSSAGGGIVGGAAISESLASYLRGTRLQVGYGQTEASPGILLGEPGVFSSGYLGKEVGIAVSLGGDGELWFRGKNGTVESLDGDGLHSYPHERWISTGDYVEKKDDDYFFLGRKSSSFKLSNGKMFFAEDLERKIYDENRVNILLFPRGETLIVLTDADSEIIENLVPEFLKTEKFKIYQVSNWSKDRKGNTARRTMMESFKQENKL